MKAWRAVLGPIGAAGLAALLAGCGDLGDREDAAASAAVRFSTAAGGTDGSAACGLLAPATVDELERSEETTCSQAVTGAGISPGAVRRVDVYGRQARVVMDADRGTLFLSAFADGWRVTAAGCVARSDQEPYRCEIQGR